MTQEDIKFLRDTYDYGPEIDCLEERNALIWVLDRIANNFFPSKDYPLPESGGPDVIMRNIAKKALWGIVREERL